MLAVCGHCSSRCSPFRNSTNDVSLCLHACTWSFEIFSTDCYTFSVLLINPRTIFIFIFFFSKLKEIKKKFVNTRVYIYIRLLNWNIQSWYSWKRKIFTLNHEQLLGYNTLCELFSLLYNDILEKFCNFPVFSTIFIINFHLVAKARRSILNEFFFLLELTSFPAAQSPLARWNRE